MIMPDTIPTLPGGGPLDDALLDQCQGHGRARFSLMGRGQARTFSRGRDTTSPFGVPVVLPHLLTAAGQAAAGQAAGMDVYTRLTALE